MVPADEQAGASTASVPPPLTWPCLPRGQQAWLPVPAVPTVPALTDLDLREDGTLDLRQKWFSGRFCSIKLESKYKMYTYALWRPRLRVCLLLAALVELYSIIDSFICTCGQRFGTYQGQLLNYTLIFPGATIVVGIVLLSPRFTKRVAPHAPVFFASLTFIFVYGYLLPITFYLRGLPVLIDTGRQLATDALWVVNTVNVILALLTTFATSLGIGPLPLFIYSVILYGCYFFYSLTFLEHTHGSTFNPGDALFPVSGFQVLIMSVLASLHNSNFRQQYVVRIYAAHERDTRVEQLQREKERLEYERRFAVREAERHSPELHGRASQLVLRASRNASQLSGGEAPQPQQLTSLGSGAGGADVAALAGPAGSVHGSDATRSVASDGGPAIRICFHASTGSFHRPGMRNGSSAASGSAAGGGGSVGGGGSGGREGGCCCPATSGTRRSGKSAASSASSVNSEVIGLSDRLTEAKGSVSPTEPSCGIAALSSGFQVIGTGASHSVHYEARLEALWRTLREANLLCDEVEGSDVGLSSGGTGGADSVQGFGGGGGAYEQDANCDGRAEGGEVSRHLVSPTGPEDVLIYIEP